MLPPWKKALLFLARNLPPFCRGIISEETKRESCSCLGIITEFLSRNYHPVRSNNAGIHSLHLLWGRKGSVSRKCLAPFFKNLAYSHHGFKVVTVADYKFDFFKYKKTSTSMASLSHLNFNTVFEKLIRIKYNNLKNSFCITLPVLRKVEANANDNRLRKFKIISIVLWVISWPTVEGGRVCLGWQFICWCTHHSQILSQHKYAPYRKKDHSNTT